MNYTPQPKESFLDSLERLKRKGEKRWRDQDGNLYQYDGEHGGEIEKYNKRGFHIGVARISDGKIIKPAKRGRTINV